MVSKIHTEEGTEIIVDPISYDAVSRFNWHIHKDGEPIAHMRINGEKRAVKMKFIITESFKHGRNVYYINNNPLDNRLCNLTFCRNKIEIFDEYAIVKTFDEKRSAMIDLRMIGLIKQFSWSITKKGYAYRTENNQKFYLHNLIMGIEVDDKTNYVDHIDGNPSNNLMENLRICTIAENNLNKIKSANKNYSSKYKGVSLNKKSNKWRVGVKLQGEIVYSDYFTNELAAASAYNYYARIHHGEFAKLNDIDEMSKLDFEKFKYKANIDYNTRHGNGSNFIGVLHRKRNDRWIARCFYHGEEHYIGSFDTELEAAKAYNEVVVKNNLDRKLNDLSSYVTY